MIPFVGCVFAEVYVIKDLMSHAYCLFYKLHILKNGLADVSACSLGPLPFVKLPNRVQQLHSGERRNCVQRCCSSSFIMRMMRRHWQLELVNKSFCSPECMARSEHCVSGYIRNAYVNKQLFSTNSILSRRAAIDCWQEPAYSLENSLPRLTALHRCVRRRLPWQATSLQRI
jgi:hypothetical protein